VSSAYIYIKWKKRRRRFIKGSSTAEEGMEVGGVTKPGYVSGDSLRGL